MASTTYIGTGEIVSADFKTVKWVGLTKGGSAVTITLNNAINVGNIDWTFAEKNDVVPSITYEACYSNTDTASSSNTEPWTIEVDGSDTGASSIVLGAGKFYLGSDLVALTRGGGSFNVERESREINADGDRGKVKDRVVFEGSRARLTMNVLTMLENVTELYSGIDVSV